MNAMVDEITKFDLIRAEAARATLRHLRPTDGEERYISDASAYLTAKHPFWAHLLYAEARVVYTDSVPYAATDGHYIYVNVPGCVAAGFGIAEMAFVLAHEICHIIFGDLILMVKFKHDNGVWTKSRGLLPYDSQFMNQMEDYRINAVLVASGVGKMPKIGLYDRTISMVGDETGVELYEKYFHGAKGGSGGGGSGAGNGMPQGHGGFDIHLEPVQKAVDAVESGQRDQIIAAAANAAIAAGQGDLPACIMRILGEILEPKVAWEDHLKATINRCVGEPALDWTRQDRRLLQRVDPMYFARPGHFGANCVAVGWDTSGSTHGLVDAFFAEMSGIVKDLNPAQLIVIRCDTTAHGVDELEDPDDLNGLRTKLNEEGIGGGGGSNMIPIFTKLEEMDIVPDVLVVLTDLHATLPDMQPDFPVVWACTTDKKGPWGDTVRLEL